MVKTRQCGPEALLATARVICLFQTIKSGLPYRQNVRTSRTVLYKADHPVSFEDETEQTALDYLVVEEASSPVLPRTTRKARFSTSTSTIPSIPSPTQTFLPSHKTSHSRTESLDSLLLPGTPRDHPKLADLNEAFLLRHFQRNLGPWVLTIRLNREQIANPKFSLTLATRNVSSPRSWSRRRHPTLCYFTHA